MHSIFYNMYIVTAVKYTFLSCSRYNKPYIQVNNKDAQMIHSSRTSVEIQMHTFNYWSVLLSF